MPQQGLLEPGNIDLASRPTVRNTDGSVSTVRSISINDNGREILIPTVVNGKVVSNDEAVQQYRRTGQHLGVFDSPDHATAFAQGLHQQEAQRIGMPDQLQSIVQKMIDAGEPEENIATVIQHYQTQPPAAPTGQRGVVSPNEPGAPDLPFGLSSQGFKEGAGGAIRGMLRTVKNTAFNHPAETGAMLGGMAAVPLTGGASLLPALAAAGLGGAGGAGVGMIGGAAAGSPNVPSTPQGVLREMGTQGAVQAGAEGGGRLVQGALKAGASRLYQGVLKPTLAARQEFPNLVQTGLERGIPVTSSGAEKAAGLVGESKDAADALVQRAAAAPNAATIDPRQAVGGITQAVRDVRQLPVARPQMKAIGDYGRQYISEHPRPLSLTDAQSSVRATDRFYDPSYRATMDRGNPITTGSTAAALGINDETRNLLRQAVPGLREQNATTQGLEGIRQAVERRVGQQGNLSPVGMQHLINAGLGAGAGTLGGSGRGIGTFLGMESLTNPAIASRLAIGANATGKLPFAQLLRAAILAKLAPNQEPQGDAQNR